MGRFDAVLKDPEYLSLKEDEKIQVWDGLFEKYVVKDPEYQKFNDNEKQEAYSAFVNKYYKPKAVEPPKIDKYGIVQPKGLATMNVADVEGQSQEKRQIVSDIWKHHDKEMRKATEAEDPSDIAWEHEKIDQAGRIDTLRKQYALEQEEEKKATIRRAQYNYTAKKVATQESELNTLLEKPELTSDEQMRVKFLQDRIPFDKSLLPYYETGQTERERDASDSAKAMMEKAPALSYPIALGMGAAGLLTSPYTMFAPDSKLSRSMQGYMAGMQAEGSTVGNIVRGVVYSAPMTAAIVLNPLAGTVLSQTMMTSDVISDYYKDGKLTDREALTASVSGAIQGIIEYGTTQSQIKLIQNAWKEGGEAGAKALITQQIKDMVTPSWNQAKMSILKTGWEEGLEEVSQNVSDKLIRAAINNDPLPEMRSWVNELALDFVGGMLGGVVFGGIGTGVNLRMNKNTIQAINQYKDISPAISTLSEAVDSLNKGDMEKAQKLYNAAKMQAGNIDIDANGEKINPAPSQNKALMRSFALVGDAVNLNNARIAIEKELKDKEENPKESGQNTDQVTEENAPVIAEEVANPTEMMQEQDAAPVLIDTTETIQGSSQEDGEQDTAPVLTPTTDEQADQQGSELQSGTISGNQDKQDTEKPVSQGTRVKPKAARVVSNHLLDNPELPKVDVQYEIMEADDMTASHTEENSVNTLYPKEMQPRFSREDNNMRMQNEERARTVIPEVYADSPLVQNGAPIVADDNVVDVGNGRAMALKRMWKHHTATAEAYKQWLIDNAERYGLDPEAIRNMNKPVMVKRRQTELSWEQRIALAGGSNIETTDKYTPVEQSISDAKAIGDMDINFDYNVDGTVNWNSDPVFVRKFLEHVVPKSQWNAMAPGYSPTSALITRIVNSLIIRAYGDNVHSRFLINSINDASSPVAKNIINSLVMIAPKISQVKQEISREELYPLDISESIMKSAARYVRAVMSKEPIDVLIDQAEVAVEDELNDMDRQVLRRMAKHNKSPKQLVDEINNYYRYVEKFGSPQQMSILEGSPVISTFDLYKIVTLEKDIEQNTIKLQDILKQVNKLQDKAEDIALTDKERKAIEMKLAEAMAVQKAIESELEAGKKEIAALRSRQSFIREEAILKGVEKHLEKSTDAIKKALVGMMPKDAVKDVQSSSTAITVSFADGRQVTINLLQNLINVKWQGKDRLATGRMTPQTANGKLTAVIDIVRAYNENNTVAYHEGFHMAYLMFLNEEQRNYLQGYYKGKATKRGYNSEEVGDPVFLEELMADEFAEYAVRADGKNSNMITRMWDALLKRIGNFLEKMGVIDKGIKNLFQDIKIGAYENTSSLSSAETSDTSETDSSMTPDDKQAAQIKDNQKSAFSQDKSDPSTRYRVLEEKNRLADPEVNAKFNEEIQQYSKSNNGMISDLKLGMPSDILILSGVANKEIVLSTRTLRQKTEKHQYDVLELVNLPLYINNPIAVMDSQDNTDTSKLILTEIESKHGNMLVVLDVMTNPKAIEIVKIKSVYPKTKSGVASWIIETPSKVRYINKEKILGYLTDLTSSNRSVPNRISKAIDKINESVGLSSPKFAEVREMLLKNSDKGEIDAENPDIRYSLAPEYNPTKTIIGYKLFRVNPKQPGKYFPLFIGKGDGIPVGVWAKADFIPTKGFAYRPGWHSGTMPYAPHLLRTSDGTLAGERVWVEVEIPADINWQGIANTQKSKDIKDKVPEDGYYRFKTNPKQGDAWIISGAIKINRVLSDGEVNEINEKAGISDPIKRRENQDTGTRHKLADPEVNAKFNEALRGFDPTKHRNRRISLGLPGDILSKCGIVSNEILIFGRTIQDKTATTKHKYDPQYLMDLPQKINDPIFVMDSITPTPGDAQKSKTILTEIRTKDGNILVILRALQRDRNLEVNQIVSVYPKNDSGVGKWIKEHQEAFQYINKEKALAFLSDIYEGSNSPRWLKLTKAIDNINESVGLSSPKFAEVREMLLKNSDRGETSAENPDIRYSFLDEKLEELARKYDESLSMVKRLNGDPLAMAKELAEAKGLDEKQMKDKFGRIFRSADREAEAHLSESLKAMGINTLDRWVETNKPYDKEDLTFHLDQAEKYARQMGLSQEDYDKLGVDGYSYYISSLNVYSHMTSLAKMVYELQQKVKSINLIDSNQEQQDLLMAYNVALDKLETAVIKYNEMKSNAGRLLRHAREMKTAELRKLVDGALSIGKFDTAQIEELNRLNKEIEAREKTISDFEKMQADIMGAKAELEDLEAQKRELQKQLDTLKDQIDTARGIVDQLRAEYEQLNEQKKELSRKIKELKDKLEQLQKVHQAIKDRLEDIKAELGQLKREKDRIMEEIKGLEKKLEGVKAKINKAKDPQDLLSKIKPSFYDNFKTLYYGNMLSGPITHIKNIISTMMNMAVEQLVLDILQPGNIIESKKQIANNWKQARDTAKEAYLRGNSSKYDIDMQKHEGKMLKLHLQVFKFLQTEDAFLTEMMRASKLSSIAYQESKGDRAKYHALLENPSPEMLRQVEIESKRAAFNNNPEGPIVGTFYGATDVVQKTLDNYTPAIGMGIRMVIPFIRVPANVFQSVLSWSPFGYITAINWKFSPKLLSQQQGGDYFNLLHKDKKVGFGAGGWARKVKKTTTDPVTGKTKTEEVIDEINPFAAREAAMQFTKATIGTVLMTMLFAIGKGIISGGGPRDPKKREQLMLTGWQEYSIRIGDKWISYRDWFPLALALSIVGNYYDYVEYNGNEDESVINRILYATMGVGRMILDRSFMSGLSELISAIESQDGKYIQRLTTRTVGTVFTPNILKQIEYLIWGREQFKPETMAEHMIIQLKPYTRIKSIMNTVPRRIDMFGEEQKRPGGLWAAFGIPVNESNKYMVGGKNLVEVLKASTDKGLYFPTPKSATLTIKGEKYKLKGKDFEMYRKWHGKYMGMYISDQYFYLMGMLDTQTDEVILDYYSALSRKARQRAEIDMMIQGLQEKY